MVFCCPFCCVFECLEAIYVAERLFFFQKFLHLKFKSQLSAGCLLQLCLFIRPLAGSLMAYSSNPKLSYSKSPEGCYSSWEDSSWGGEGFQTVSQPFRFHLAVPPESSLPQIRSCPVWLQTPLRAHTPVALVHSCTRAANVQLEWDTDLVTTQGRFLSPFLSCLASSLSL